MSQTNRTSRRGILAGAIALPFLPLLAKLAPAEPLRVVLFKGQQPGPTSLLSFGFRVIDNASEPIARTGCVLEEFAFVEFSSAGGQQAGADQ